jgi:hypothetical protein
MWSGTRLSGMAPELWPDGGRLNANKRADGSVKSVSFLRFSHMLFPAAGHYLAALRALSLGLLAGKRRQI